MLTTETPAKRSAHRRRRARSRWPRITVVTPSFNQGRYLEATLRSVLDQGYPELEYLVIDGGSRDQSRRILERYDDRLAYWTSEGDRGQAHAINRGLERASGDIVGWLNSDDLLLPGSLRAIARAFRRAPETAIVTGLRRRIDAEGRPLGNWLRDPPTARYLRRYCCVAQETVYWRREISDEIGLLDERFSYALDYEYWLRMLEAGYRFRWLPRYLGAFREHAESKSATRRDDYRRDLAALYRRYRLGRNEESVLAQLGEAWPLRLALLEDLGTTRWSHSARAVGWLLRALERPRGEQLATRIYRRYRSLRPRGAAEPSRPSAVLRSGWRELLGRPLDDRRPALLYPSDPLNRPRLTAAELDRDFSAFSTPLAAPLMTLGPPDTLNVGAGWSWVEHSPDHVYRWADNDAEIVVLRPSGLRSRLELDLEAGPSLGWQDFELEVLDETGRTVLARRVGAKETVALDLALEAGPAARVFRLRVPERGGAASAADARVLRFRATRIAWAEAEPRYDLPIALGEKAEILLDRDARSAACFNGSMPRRGLFLGRGWFAARAGERGRRAVQEAEVVVTGASGMALRCRLDPDLAGSTLTFLDARGGPLAARPIDERGRAIWPLPAPLPAVGVFRLRLESEPARRAFRVYDLAWATDQETTPEPSGPA